MFKLVYNWLVESKAKNVYGEYIEEAIEIASKYALWDNTVAPYEILEGVEVDGSLAKLTRTSYFCTSHDDELIIDFFHEDLHIHASIRDDKKVYYVRIKKQGEPWMFDISNKNRFNPSNPENETYQVYVWFMLPTPDAKMVDGYKYEHGNWDKKVYYEMKSFYRQVNSETDSSKFNDNYKK